MWNLRGHVRFAGWIALGVVGGLLPSVRDPGGMTAAAHAGTRATGFVVDAGTSTACPPSVAVTFTATPAVTTPVASVAQFHPSCLPAIAAIVMPMRLHGLRAARIGGLHGP